MSNTIDEILELLIKNDRACSAIGDHHSANIANQAYDEASEALYQLILTEVIGEDRRYKKYEECPVCRNYQYSCSCDEAEHKVKAEQRQTLAKLFNQENYNE